MAEHSDTTERLLNLHNGADIIINLYPLRVLFGRDALGRFGFSPGDRLRMGRLSPRVLDWDVTMKIGSAHAWSYYYRRPEIAAVMGPLLVFSNGPSQSFTPMIGSRISRESKPPALLLRDSTRTEESSAMRSGL